MPFVVALLIGGAVVGSTALYLSLPDDQSEGSVLIGTTSKCEAPSSLGRPAAQTVPGVVSTLQLHQERDILQQRKPWNRGRFVVSEWQPLRGTVKFFARYAGNTYDTYPIGERRSFFRNRENEMGLWVIGDMPERFVQFRE